VTDLERAVAGAKGLLFDLDGTLIDSDPIHRESWAEILADHGIAVDDELYRSRFSGRLNPAIVAEFLPDLDAAAGAAVCERKEAMFRALVSRVPPVRGVLVFARAARARGRKLAVVTNAPRRNVLAVLRAIGLDDLWDAIVVSEELEAGKPDPAPYRAALERLGVGADDAVAFEDSTAGVRSAVGAGVPCIALTTTAPAADLLACGARLAIADFDSLTNLWAEEPENRA